MKKSVKKGMQKATALLLATIMILSAFAVMPADLFKASAAEDITVEERYEAVKNQIDGLILDSGSSDTADYNLYSANSTNYVVPDGEYVVTGATGLVMTNGFQATSTSATGTADTWFFERQANGKYYIKTADGQYLNIDSSGLSVTANAQQLVVRITAASETTIGDGKGIYINYSGNSVVANAAATSLTLNTITRTEAGQTQTELVKRSSIESGKSYVIVHDNKVMTSVMTDGHMTFDGTPSADSETWKFTEADGGYYLQTGNGQYFYLDGDDSKWPKLQSSASVVQCTFESDILRISQEFGCDPFYVQLQGNNYVGSTSGTGATTYLYLYEKVTTTASETGIMLNVFVPTTATTATPIDDGGYVVYHDGVIMGHDSTHSSSVDATGVIEKTVTVSNNTINTLVTDQYYFEHVEDNLYKVMLAAQSADGEGVSYKYLHFNGSEGYLAFTQDPEAVIVYANANGTVQILDADSSQKVNHYTSNGNIFSSYGRNSVSSPDGNESLTLYRNPNAVKGTVVSVDKTELYNVLNDATTYAPKNYTEESYNNFLDTLEVGIVTYNDKSIIDKTEVDNAVTDIRNAIVNLEKLSSAPDYRSFPATLYKYGYNPASSGNSRYSAGGASFNAQTYASMEAIIRADESLMAQIKEAIGYDTRTWNDGQAETALNTAVTTYAEIYSLSFTGNTLSSGGSDVSDYQKTSWNVWTKTDTTGTGESSDGGASIQGIYSSSFADGHPTDHAPYSELPYGNIADYYSSTYNTADGISISFTAGSSNVSVALPPLKGISVHVNDIFTRQNVLVDGSTTAYSKFYWDFDFPFLTTTNNYGVNTYKYSSSDDNYLFQAKFNDDNHTADVQLTNLGTATGGNGGFFPFNYQQGVTSYTGETSIYHYGMSFSTSFYVPVSGTYADGEDIVFKFSGDDDVLVYVDDVLVLDNGGLHAAREADINFTDASVTYQFAIDITEGTVKDTEYATVYDYDENGDYNADTLAALEKLNEVRTDGEYHTFTFYYLERGSNESNCEIEFNMQHASNHVLLNDETLVVDYGLPVEYNIRGNDEMDEIDGLSYSYEGVVVANTEVDSVVLFDEPDDLVSRFASENDVVDVQGLKYGTATMRGDGLVTYTPTTMNMTDRDYFYTCAEIEGDPTYTKNYYQYERAIFIPATTIYYEDNFGADISFTDGSGNAKWTTVGDTSAFANAKQAADLVDSDTANPYGFDPIYAGTDGNNNYTQYSGFSAQKVTVSSANNSSKGGTSPTVKFSFTGTGFDVISMTDNTTGVFYVEIFDEAGNQVGKRKVVDTYYGYSYGQLYADASGETTLEVTDTPIYKSALNEAVTTFPTYYSVDGTAITEEPTYLAASGVGYTETPTYYDADGNLTETETEDIAYAYAYAFGWVKADDVVGLYQIPVIKVNGLDYGKYSVVITPMYTAMFDHTGNGQFDLYIDAIRVYDPAGKDDKIESSILTDYKYDKESYSNHLEFKDMLIGADSLSKDSATQGVVFIDGIAALDNDLEKLKLAGPNNELYLAKGQAVAFEIWASAVPDEVQIGMKSGQGAPKFTVTYENSVGEKELKTATEMNYIVNDLLSADNKLAWSEVTVNGVTYYRTNTIVIQNASADDSILAITSLKWTFTGVGQYGQHEISATEPAVMSFMSSSFTVSDAYTMMAANAPVEDDADDNAGAEIIPGDNDDTNDTNDDYQEELTFIQKIIKAITNFFKKIFGLA